MKQEYLTKLHNSQLKILDEIVRICDKYNLDYFLVAGTLLGAVRHSGYIPWDDDLDIGMPRKDYIKFMEYAEKELNKEYLMDCFKFNKRYWLPFIKVRLRNTSMAEANLKDYDGCKGIFVDIFPLDNAKSEDEKSIKTRKSKEEKIKTLLIKKNITKVKTQVGFKNKFKVITAKMFSNRFLHFVVDRVMQSEKDENSEYFVNFGSNYKIEKQTHLKSKYYPAKKLKFEDREYCAPNDYDYVLTKIYGPNYMELPPLEKRITHKPLSVKFEDGEYIEFNEKGEEINHG